MRVAHIIKVVRIAGAERHLLTLLPGLREQGIETEVILLVPPGNPMQDYVDALTAHGIPVQRMIIRHHADLSVLRRLRALLRETKPDIVHTHLLHADLFGIPAARLAGVRGIITSRHNDDTFRRWLPFKLVNFALWRMTSAGIAISTAIARFCIKVEGAPPNKLHTIYYGLEAQAEPIDRKAARADLRRQVGAEGNALVIGIACRLIRQKGVTYALQAFAQIAGRFPQARLVIVGDGPLRGTLQREARALGIDGQTNFLGWRADIDRVLAGFDVLLVPSLWEGFGLVMLEAMRQSVPVVGSAVSAIPEVVANGVSGRLVPPRDPNALAYTLNTLLSDLPLLRHMGMMSEDRVEEQFTAAHMVSRTREIYESVLARRR